MIVLFPLLILLMVPLTGCSQDDSLHIHMISGSRQYESEPSLLEFKKVIEQHNGGAKVTISRGEDAGDYLPDLEGLANADLMLVFTRRMRLPEEQLNLIKRHIEKEKPVIGIRTASHAFKPIWPKWTCFLYFSGVSGRFCG